MRSLESYSSQARIDTPTQTPTHTQSIADATTDSNTTAQPPTSIPPTTLSLKLGTSTRVHGPDVPSLSNEVILSYTYVRYDYGIMYFYI